MKKMLLATALALLITGCAQQTFAHSKQTDSSSTRKPSYIIFFVSGIGQRNCRCSQNCGGAENVVKAETQQTFVNGLLGFITLGIYTPLEARGNIAHNRNCVSYPIDKGQLYLCSLIYFWVPSSCLHSDQPSLRVK